MSDVITTEHYTAPDGTRYRIQLHPDTDASSPRGDSNVTTMHTFDRGWFSPDGELCQDRYHHRQVHPIIPAQYVQDGRVDMRRARRWVALFGKAAGILAIDALHRVPGGNYEGTLVVGNGWRRDPDAADGYIAVTQAGWDECMGDSPLAGGPWLLTSKGAPDPDNSEGNRTPSATEVMQQEVEAYNHWANGEYVGFTVQQQVKWVRADAIGNESAYDDEDTMSSWADVEDASLWGIDDEEYALEEARMFLPDGSVKAAI